MGRKYKDARRVTVTQNFCTAKKLVNVAIKTYLHKHTNNLNHAGAQWTNSRSTRSASLILSTDIILRLNQV